MDWSQLVDTATKATTSIEQRKSPLENGSLGSGGKQRSTVLLNNTDDQELARAVRLRKQQQQHSHGRANG